MAHKVEYTGRSTPQLQELAAKSECLRGVAESMAHLAQMNRQVYEAQESLDHQRHLNELHLEREKAKSKLKSDAAFQRREIQFAEVTADVVRTIAETDANRLQCTISDTVLGESVGQLVGREDAELRSAREGVLGRYKSCILAISVITVAILALLVLTFGILGLAKVKPCAHLSNGAIVSMITLGSLALLGMIGLSYKSMQNAS